MPDLSADRVRCQGHVTDGRRARRCPGWLDPVLPAYGFRTHPNCQPGETSPQAGQAGDPASLPRDLVRRPDVRVRDRAAPR